MLIFIDYITGDILMKKILAVDLGISSFGFAVCIENDTNTYTCIDHGVIMRNTPYDKQGNSSQSEFSQKRRLSKLYHKRKKRIKKIAEIFDQYGILALHKALSIQKSNPVTDKWSLRATTVFQRALSPEELFAIFSHMAKHRGYKSIVTF